jgi:hypothetical protein
MTRGCRLIGAALVAAGWLCASGVSHPRSTESGVIEFGSPELAASFDDRVSDAGAHDGSLATKAFTIATSCIVGSRLRAGSGVECAGTTLNDRFILLADRKPGSTDDLDATPFGISAGATRFDGAAPQSSFDDFSIASSGVSADPKDDLLEARYETPKPGPWWIPKRDVYPDAVPALSALALLVAGLLVLGLARRRRRSAWARRIKRSSDRQQREQ